MATKADFDSAVADSTAALASIQQRITDLINKVNAGGMSADDENAALNEVQQLRDQLKATAAPTT